jgi:hypothetical protein
LDGRNRIVSRGPNDLRPAVGCQQFLAAGRVVPLAIEIETFARLTTKAVRSAVD